METHTDGEKTADARVEGPGDVLLGCRSQNQSLANMHYNNSVKARCPDAGLRPDCEEGGKGGGEKEAARLLTQV